MKRGSLIAHKGKCKISSFFLSKDSAPLWSEAEQKRRKIFKVFST